MGWVLTHDIFSPAFSCSSSHILLYSYSQVCAAGPSEDAHATSPVVVSLSGPGRHASDIASSLARWQEQRGLLPRGEQQVREEPLIWKRRSLCMRMEVEVQMEVVCEEGDNCMWV